MMGSMNGQKRRPAGPGRMPARKTQKGLSKNIFFYFLIGFLILSTFFTLSTDSSQGEEKPISEILELISGDQVKEVEVLGDIVVATLKDDSQVFARKETGDPFLEILSRHEISASQIEGGVKISEGFPWADLLLDLLPIGLTVLFFV
ncbi:ATP-dependent metallopeptidase FtsH/Yme1/Tma family protein, partial [Candidatus Parcubacteria bacterium]|nr:ATP-dependent metallopeptidase FtsH/Yme1/Tma family protein [Candidatus Parcubacteria bacterium]